jgi:hypothetical protein
MTDHQHTRGPGDAPDENHRGTDPTRGEGAGTREGVEADPTRGGGAGTEESVEQDPTRAGEPPGPAA